MLNVVKAVKNLLQTRMCVIIQRLNITIVNEGDYSKDENWNPGTFYSRWYALYDITVNSLVIKEHGLLIDKLLYDT